MLAEPAAFSLLKQNGTSPVLLVCEHASRFVPDSYAGLGLSEPDLLRHIAWDIGAAAVTKLLSDELDAVAILANHSRLLIDLNRPLHSPTSIPEISESTVVPGNLGLTTTQRQSRAALYFEPFHRQLSTLLDARQAAEMPTIIVGVHSFTPVFNGRARPWHAGVLFRHSHVLGMSLVAALGGAEARIAANEPYQIEDLHDYAIPVHGEARGLDAVLVELRQDLIADAPGVAFGPSVWPRRCPRSHPTIPLGRNEPTWWLPTLRY